MEVAQELLEQLRPYCERITIAGSLRRQRPTVGDIELLTIPGLYAGITDMLDTAVRRMLADRILDYRPTRRSQRVYGPQTKLLVHVPSGIPVDIFSTSEERWYTALVVRTGGAETNRRIATAARAFGFQLLANGVGFQTPTGTITCNSEREVFDRVGLRYLEPWERS